MERFWAPRAKLKILDKNLRFTRCWSWYCAYSSGHDEVYFGPIFSNFWKNYCVLLTAYSSLQRLKPSEWPHVFTERITMFF